MKILYIVPYVPNQIRVRPYEIIRTLAQRGHQVTLATLWSNRQEHEHLLALAKLGIKIVAQPLTMVRSLWNCLWALPAPIPLQSVYAWQPELALQIKDMLRGETFDIVHIEHLRGTKYGLALKSVLSNLPMPTPLIWDSVDCISHLFAQAARHSRSTTSRLLKRLELQRTRRYEGWLVHQFDRVLITSQADRQALYKLGLEASTRLSRPEQVNATSDLADRFSVLPNGVNLDDFFPTPDERQPATVIFSGKMSYHANVSAALHLVQDIMPRVWQQCPAVDVEIVGKDPPPIIRALDTRSAGQGKARGAQQGNVTVTGTVPQLQPYLCRATLAVAPVVYGAGIQNKVLEAMACGTPVIASSQAAAGLYARPGHDLLVADTPERFADHILSLLQDAQRRRQLGAAGHAYVTRYHTWPHIVTNLEEIYQMAIDHIDKGITDHQMH
jgi:polysaccharide biosynthesis protein PslH